MSSILEAKRNIKNDLKSKRGDNKIISKISDRLVDKTKVVKGIHSQKSRRENMKSSI